MIVTIVNNTNPVVISGAGGSEIALSTDHWFRLNATFTNQGNNQILYEASFFDLGADGNSSAVLLTAFSDSFENDAMTSVGNVYAGFSALADGGIALADNFGVPTSETPLPATFPLFATGLGALGCSAGGGENGPKRRNCFRDLFFGFTGMAAFMTSVSIYECFKRWVEIAPGFTPIVAAAAVGLAFQQLRAIRINQRETTAKNVFREYLKLTIDYPLLAAAKFDKNSEEERERYKWFVANFLWAAEEILSFAKKDVVWRDNLQLHANPHREYFLDPAFMKEDFEVYSRDVQLLIRAAINQDMLRTFTTPQQ